MWILFLQTIRLFLLLLVYRQPDITITRHSVIAILLLLHATATGGISKIIVDGGAIRIQNIAINSFEVV